MQNCAFGLLCLCWEKPPEAYGESIRTGFVSQIAFQVNILGVSRSALHRCLTLPVLSQGVGCQRFRPAFIVFSTRP